jgi:pimeloyl-ACP methyl ester carboxylesterase
MRWTQLELLMKKMLVFLPGNPLDGREFELIVKELEKADYQCLIHKRPIKGSKLEPLLQSINAITKVSGGGSFGLAAYSWGAYLALSYLKRFPENVTDVLLINPLLADTSPLPWTQRIVLKTPILRSLLLKFLSKKKASKYLEKIFSPQNPSEEIKKNLHAFLSQAVVWRGEYAYKKLMSTNPLSKESLVDVKVPVRVLFGAEDPAAPKEGQMPILQKCPTLSFDTIPSTGHSLPWTHPKLLIEEIQKM